MEGGGTAVKQPMIVSELAWPSPRATWLGEDDLEFRLGKNETLKRNSTEHGGGTIR